MARHFTGSDGSTYRLADEAGNYVDVGDTVASINGDLHHVDKVHAPHSTDEDDHGFIKCTSQQGIKRSNPADFYSLHFEHRATEDAARLARLIIVAQSVCTYAEAKWCEGEDIWSTIAECHTAGSLAKGWMASKYAPRTVSGAIAYELKWAKVMDSVYKDRQAQVGG